MRYDVLIAGGGLAGSALAIALCRAGHKVGLCEREPTFRDRVRGEGMLPWGWVEARSLGLDQELLDRCGIPVRWCTTPEMNRDLPATTPSGLGFLDFYHPEMQQCLLDVAVAAGVEVHRPAEVTGVTGNPEPSVTWRAGGKEYRAGARLVVGADGRNSRIRSLVGFRETRDPDCLIIAGTLYRGMKLPEDAVQLIQNPALQRLSIVFPIGQKRYRAYLAHRHDAFTPLTGERDRSTFLELSVATGADRAWFEGAEPIGPLASFPGADVWVEHPYRDGIALIGDAAAATDPSWGCGLSLSLRDVRVLRDALASTSDWHAAGEAFAREHDVYRAGLHRIQADWRSLFYDIGPEADAIRQRALPLHAEDPSRMMDFIALGPEAPHDDHARRRFFGEV